MPIKVTAVIPICENMISGQCMKVGDVVKTLNGLHITVRSFTSFRPKGQFVSKTETERSTLAVCTGFGFCRRTLKSTRCSQIENTDMEGRLMLADALVYGQAVYKPSLVIDVATLTRKPREPPRAPCAWRPRPPPRLHCCRRRAAGHGRRRVRRLHQLRGGMGRAAPRGRRQRRPALALPALEVLLDASHQCVSRTSLGTLRDITPLADALGCVSFQTKCPLI